MDLLEALADEVTPREFFMDWAPRLFAARQVNFDESSDIDLIFCFKFQDTDEVFTVEASSRGMVCEDDEMIDFPAITVLGWEKYWPAVKEGLRPLAEALEKRRDEVSGSFRLTEALGADWEKFDVAIDVEVVGAPGDVPVKFTLVLNDYEVRDGMRRFGFTIDHRMLDAMADGKQTPEQVARGLRIHGDVRVAATLGGMLLSHAKPNPG